MIKEITDISLINQQLIDLISLAISPLRAKSLLTNAIQNQNEACFVYVIDHKIVGVITIQAIIDYCEITSIAIDNDHQNNGHGKLLLDYIKRYYNYIIAETDDEAVNFYRKEGFFIQSLGEKYPGTFRYKCIFRGVYKNEIY